MSQPAVVDPAHPELRAALDLFAAWIEYRLAYWSLPGISIAVVHDQQLVWARAFGKADVERGIAATPTTRYRIGSVTKLFTATAVMQLRDAGALTLDDPVARHLPWFKIARGHDHADVALTIRHLLSHTSGLPREAAFPYWEALKFPPIAEVRDGLLRQSTALSPESQWRYRSRLASTGGIASPSGSRPTTTSWRIDEMDTTEFEGSLKRAGFQEIETKKVAANTATQPHSHAFSVRALVLAGDVTLTSEGQSRTFRAGEVFEMTAGCVHSERHGPDGSMYLVGRRT